MGVLNRIRTTVKKSNQFVSKAIEDYISFDRENKQILLKEKSVLLLCNQAVKRVEQLKSLEPDLSEGLIAAIEYNKVQVKIHFTPEKMILNKDNIEGQLRLLTKPQFQTENIIYRYLIAAWQNFLGGKVTNAVLSENTIVEGTKVYYRLPRNQSRLIEALFSSLRNKSALETSIKQGELTIKTSVALSWNDFNLQSLLQLLHR